MLKIYAHLLEELPVRLLQIPSEVLSSTHLAVVYLVNATASFHRLVFESLRLLELVYKFITLPVHLQPIIKV